MNIMAALGLDFAGTVQIDKTNLIRYNATNQISLEETLWHGQGLIKLSL